LLAGGLGLALLLWAGAVQARAGGIAVSSCEGCHGGPGDGKLSIAADPATFQPGERVELTLSISGGYSAGGVYVDTAEIGDLEALSNQGLTEVTTGLVHNQPKPATGGTVQFRFAWVAPAAPGNVRFNVYALGADGNGRSSGDSGLDGAFDFVYGCTGAQYFLDGDADGVGRDNFSMLACDNAPPVGYAPVPGDCDDFRKGTFPGAPELCNMVDDDCDGMTDEDAVPVELWPDADGDGYYDWRTEMVGEPRVGCVGLEGWAAYPGDCRPQDPSIHAEAEEVCNGFDDDCDGDVDERVRPTCGEGWCRRAALNCDPAECTPGAPVQEKCNFLDDDCDGLTDEDPDLCPTGQTCAAGSCVDSTSVALDPMNTPGGGSAAGTSSTPATGGSSGNASDDSSGCALSTGAGHGTAAVLALLGAAALVRRRRTGTPKSAD
jgi:MYXO-CTERM domain-containing protein